jgi:hypothetical protein
MELEGITGIPPLVQGAIDGMRHAIRQKWTEVAMTFFVRAIINTNVAVACDEAGFSEAMVFHRNKAAWLLAQALGCIAKSMEFKPTHREQSSNASLAIFPVDLDSS